MTCNSIKLFVVAFLLEFFGGHTSSDAQILIGVGAGYTNNILSSDAENRLYTQNKRMQGYSINLTAIYKFRPVVALRADFAWIQKNSLVTRTGPYRGVFHSSKNCYIQIPIAMQLNLRKEKFRGFADFGMYAGYWALARVEGRIPNIFSITHSVVSNGQIDEYLNFTTYAEKYEFDKRKDNRLEIGWLIGIGLGYKISKHSAVFFDGRLYRSVTDHQKKYMIIQGPSYNSTYSALIGSIITF